MDSMPTIDTDNDDDIYENDVCVFCGKLKNFEEYGLVEQKVGKWIEKDGFDGDVYYDCSVCGESWTTIEGTPWDNGMNYCPHCGAKMEGEEDEQTDA